MQDILYHVDYKEVCITLKKLIAVFLFLSLCTSITGCAAGDTRNSDGSAVSSSDVSQQGESAQDNSTEAGSSGDISSLNSSSGISSAQNTSGYDKLIKELDELEQVLKSLDQISEDDLEIPTP